MKKKIIISAVSVGLALVVIGASVGTYMSYIKKYVPIAPPSALACTKSNSQKELIKNADFYISVNGDDNGDGTLEKPFQTIQRAHITKRVLRLMKEILQKAHLLPTLPTATVRLSFAAAKF